MKTLIKCCFVIFSLLLFACGNEKKKLEPEVIVVDTSEKKVEYKADKIDASFKDENLAEVFNQYIQMKTALVNTNSERTSAEASNLKLKLDIAGADDSLLTFIKTIVESTDIEEQRAAFVNVTTGVENLMQDALKSGTIYKQYCPMAFGNTGAFWLSESRDINNPYFGDKMLKCGRIDSEIK